MYQYNNNFSRVAWNEAKAGAYYTDSGHVADISRYLLFPEGHVDVLEPSCGDCMAVKTLVGGADASIYGVELNNETYKQVKKDPAVSKVLCADFLDGVRIKFKGAEKFPLVFSNPPYMADVSEEDGLERLEDKFLRTITNYLSVGGVLVWVVAEKTFKGEKQLRFIMNNYEIKYLWKFREEEYKKFHQVVAILTKKQRTMTPSDEIIKYRESIVDIKALPRNPEIAENFRVPVPNSDPEDLIAFESKEFDYESARAFFVNSEEKALDDTKRIQSKNLFERKFKSSNLRNPLVTLCDGHIAQAITCGEGQGLTGTPGVDQHLQRGICEIVKKEEEIKGENPEDDGKIKVQTFAKMKMTLIHPSGKIQKLL